MPKKRVIPGARAAKTPEVESIVVTVSIAPVMYKRLLKFKEKYGCLSDQEVLRLSLATLIEKHGA